MSALDHTNLIAESLIAAQMVAGPQWRDLGIRMGERAKALAPVSHEELPIGEYGPTRVGGTLKSSMEVRFVFGVDPRIEIGSKATVGDDDLSLFALVELGTPAHPIDPKTEGGYLVFVSRGTRVFTTKTVHHPGTKANKFAERAAQQIVHEAAGVTLVQL